MGGDEDSTEDSTMTQLGTKGILRRIIADCLVLILGTAVMIAISDSTMSGLQTYRTALHERLAVTDKYEKAKAVVCSLEC